MKIIKQPQFDICDCEICGTVFQPEAGDHIDYRCLPNGEVYNIIAYCPTCGCYCNVTTKKERSTGKEACVSCGEEIPEGRQVRPNCDDYEMKVEKTSLKHFTPEEVRNMSSAEVRKNYQSIMDSMKEWK